jgi:hypothetical protein
VWLYQRGFLDEDGRDPHLSVRVNAERQRKKEEEEAGDFPRSHPSSRLPGPHVCISPPSPRAGHFLSSTPAPSSRTPLSPFLIMPPKGSKKGIPFIPPEPSFALPALPPAPLPPLVERMRRNWRWAHISQFCTLWLQAIGGPEWDPEVSSHLSVSSVFASGRGGFLRIDSSRYSFPTQR